jgi:hypothetical protein
MQQILETFAANSGVFSLVAILAVAVLGFFVYRQGAELRRIRKQWRSLLEGSRGENLERLLESHLRDQALQSQELERIIARLTDVEKKMRSAKRYAGLVRYDAFGGMSGNLSFALALYDERGNGVVISNVVGRSDCRVYCKPLTGGRSDVGLSEEEEAAIAQAAGDRGQALIQR